MPRHIDTDKVCNDAEYEVARLREINSLLTEAGQEWQQRYNDAQAEVERLQHILNCYALQYGTVTEQQEVINKAKAEAAREIFKEIENRLLPSNASGEFIGVTNEWFDYYDLHLAEDIAELKKKYEENQT